MMSRIVLIDFGSKPPAPMVSVSTSPMSASSARLSVVSSPPASWRTARARITGSRSWKPIISPCIDSRISGSRRPTAPKSSNQRIPWGSTKMFPGWGSAWYTPSRRTWSRNDRSKWTASSDAGTGVASTASRSATVTPSMACMTRTRRVDSASTTVGAVTPFSMSRLSTKAVPLRASAP